MDVAGNDPKQENPHRQPRPDSTRAVPKAASMASSPTAVENHGTISRNNEIIELVPQKMDNNGTRTGTVSTLKLKYCFEKKKKS